MSDQYKIKFTIYNKGDITASQADSIDDILAEIFDDLDCDAVIKNTQSCHGKIHLISGNPNPPDTYIGTTVRNDGYEFAEEVQTKIRSILPKSHINACFINQDQCDFKFTGP